MFLQLNVRILNLALLSCTTFVVFETSFYAKRDGLSPERFTEAILISEFNPILGGIAGGWLIVWLLKGLLVECRWQTVADLGKMVEV